MDTNIKVHISPSPSDYHEDGTGSGGIWRIINAMAKWLPTYGVELVDTEAEADIVHIHAGALVATDKPIVQSLHGYYWTGDFAWDAEYWQYNAMVIEVSRRAAAILSPSEWVAYPVRRDLRKSPYVIPHGVEPDFVPTPHEGYVLWGKPRVDVVCNPDVVNRLAAKVPTQQFVTTFGRSAPNVKVIGAQTHEEFVVTMSKAAVWLATARETGDIASREAMLMGIPVLAWDHGATAELIQHKQTGYLARHGDLEDLAQGLEFCLANRDELGAAGREYILNNCLWKNVIWQYASVYKSVLKAELYPIDISIVIPTYNYAHFLQEALDSVQAQSIFDAYPGIHIETIVVDDCSTDNTREVLDANTWAGLRTHKHEVNRGLPSALNTGHRLSRGKYIINLDADNLFTPNALQILYEALESEPWVDVASGGLSMYYPDGNHRPATDWPFGEVDALRQLNHVNQLTSSSMVRSASIKRIGGYRPRQRKNEDGEFWCRAISAGVWIKQVSKESVLVYRWHDNNKSKVEGGEDGKDSVLSWNYYFPWAKALSIMPFASTANPPKSSWAVRSYADPHVAIIIPCGPGHELFLHDALDSVAGQTFQNIECIVANDTGKPLDVAAMGHPWVKVVNTHGGEGPAIARNTAIAAARAPLIIPLDADDMLYRDTVEMYYAAWLAHPESIVYGDCDTEDSPGKRENYTSGRFSKEAIFTDAIYQDVILFAKEWWALVGGYPIDQPYGFWEDWLFGCLMHIAGIGATYVERPWGVYRHWTHLAHGARKNDVDNAGWGTPEFKARYEEVKTWIRYKEATMACQGCKGRTPAALASATQNLGFAVDLSGPNLVIVYEGDRRGGFTFNSKADPRQKIEVQWGVNIEINPLDAWASQLPGFRLVTKETQSEPEFPVEPPYVPPDPIQESAPMVSSYVEPEPVAPAVSNLDELGISAGKINTLRQAGFVTKSDVRDDLAAGAPIISQLRGFGDVAVRKLSDELG